MKFTEAYFLEEVNRFREACGTKTFWALSDVKQDAMISGLSLCYLTIHNDDGTLPNKEQIDKWSEIFRAALDNYNRRKTMLMMLPLRKALGV